MSEITKQYQIRYNKEEVQLSDLFGVVRDLVLGMVASGAHPVFVIQRSNVGHAQEDQIWLPARQFLALNLEKKS